MSKTESDSTKREQKKQAKWVVTIFCVTILVSATISFLSNEIMAASGMLVAFLILLAIVAIGIITSLQIELTFPAFRRSAMASFAPGTRREALE